MNGTTNNQKSSHRPEESDSQKDGCELWAEKVLGDFKERNFLLAAIKYVLAPFGVFEPLIGVRWNLQDRLAKTLRWGVYFIQIVLFVGAVISLAFAIYEVSWGTHQTAGSTGRQMSVQTDESPRSASSATGEQTLGLKVAKESQGKQNRKQNLALGKTFLSLYKKWSAVLYIAGVILNIFFLGVLMLIAPLYKARDELSKGIADILGHKVWAEKNTYALLNGLISEDFGLRDRRAKWFIVKFLSLLADERISPLQSNHKDNNKTDWSLPGWRVTTQSDGTWHVRRYSRFLADNMHNAEKSIRWLVDPHDFFTFLLPELIEYVLMCVAIQNVGLPILEGDNLKKTYNKTYNDLKGRTNIIQQVAEILEMSEEDVWNNVLKQSRQEALDILERDTIDDHYVLTLSTEYQSNMYNDEKMWEIFSVCVVAPMRWLGRSLMIKMSTENSKSGVDFLKTDTICEEFQRLHEKYIRHVLPHLNAFRTAFADKSRIIFVPSATEEEQLIKAMVSKAIEDWPVQGALVDICRANSEMARKVITAAFELLEWLCGHGGKHKILEVRRPRGSSDFEYGTSLLDLGIYDDRFIVWSRGLARRRHWRFVDWYCLTRDASSCVEKNFKVLDHLREFCEGGQAECAVAAAIAILTKKDVVDYDYAQFKNLVIDTACKKLQEAMSNKEGGHET